MRLIPSVRFVTLTVSATVAAVLITPALSPVAGDRFMKAVLPERGNPVETNDKASHGTSLVRGAIAGVLPRSKSTASEEYPGAVASNGTSPFDREFRDLLTTLHKGAHPERNQQSTWRTVRDFLSPSGTSNGKLGEETVLDPEFGEITVRLDSQLGRPHSGPSRGSEGLATANSTLWVFETNLLADMEKTAPADAASDSADYARAPIGVDTGSSGGGTVVISGQPLTSGTWSETNAGTVYVPPAPNWYGLPASAPLNASYPAGNGGTSGGSLILTGPVNSPPPPNWNNFAPAPASGHWSSSVFHQRFASVATVPTTLSNTLTVASNGPAVLSSAPTVVSVAPAVVSLTPAPAVAAAVQAQTVTVPSSTGVSGGTLTTNSVGAPSGPADPGTFQPQTGSTAVIYIANNQISGSGTVKEYSATAGGPALTTNNGFTFTTISTLDPTAVTAVGTNPTLPGLWVGDSSSLTVKAYSAQTGAQISAAIFTPIAGVTPNALVVTSNGQDLFVANNAGNVKEYNALTGAVIGSFSVTTPNPISLTLSTNNQDIYIGDGSNGTVKEYAVSNGALVGAFSISNVYPGGLAMSASGQQIFLAEEDNNVVTEYNATTGSPIGFSLSPVPGGPVNLLGVGNDIYVADDGGIASSGSQVEFYSDTGSTGTAVGGFTNINGLDPTAVAYVPEPSTAFLLLGSGAMFLLRRRRAAV